MNDQHINLRHPGPCGAPLFDDKSSVPSSLKLCCTLFCKSLQEKGFASSGFAAAGKWSGAAVRGMSRSACGGSSSGRGSELRVIRGTGKEFVIDQFSHCSARVEL